ncbi:MAG: globin family protein [Chloroflexota bacterium]
MSLSSEQKQLVQQSFAQILPIAEQVSALFYDRLFQLDPDLRPLFQSDIEEQQKKFIETLEIAVQALNNLQVLVPVLQRLAIRHVDYGARNEHYDTVGNALIWALEQGLGDHFTEEVRDSWSAVYDLISSVMTKAVTLHT